MGRKPNFFITVYALRREYGGPEEGGWWYNTGYLVHVEPVFTAKWANARAYNLSQGEYATTGDLYSVNYRSGAYQITVETVWPEDSFSDWRPWE